MAQKKPTTYHTGFAQLVPSSSRGKYVRESNEVEISNKAISSGYYGKGWDKCTKTYNTEEFVDKTTGRLGYKEEQKYNATHKWNDKELGYTHEYQTQVKQKHVVYPMKNNNNYYKPVKCAMKKVSSSSSTNKNNLVKYKHVTYHVNDDDYY